MAIVYSLICWGGSAGKTVTMTIASPCEVTLTGHGLRHGRGVVFTTSGALPTGVVAGTEYYARSTTIDKFHLYDTYAHAIDTGSTTGRVNTSGSQSGTHTVKGLEYLSLASTTRWSTRIYNGLKAWRDARYSAASLLDVEVCEILEHWDDNQYTAALDLNVPAAQTIITPTVDEVPTSAAHGGVIGNLSTQLPNTGLFPGGYAFIQNTYFVNGLNFSGDNTTLEGIVVSHGSVQKQNTNLLNFPTGGLYNKAKRNLILAHSSPVQSMNAVSVTGDVCEISNNIIVGFTGTSSTGMSLSGYACKGAIITNNTVVKCNRGFYVDNVADNKQGMQLENNISVGNTTNWSAFNATYYKATGHNAGESGNAPWYKTTDTSIVMATTDFTDYANNDFTPAASTSPQVETGVALVLLDAVDSNEDERPNYVGTESGTTVTAGSFVAGSAYTIVTVGTTDFTLIGASANTVGVKFKATGVGSGTGTALNVETWDIGAHEFDRGNTRPEVHTIDFTGLVAGSQVVVFTTGTTTELFRDNSSSTSESYDAAAAGVTVDYTVMKAGYLPLRATGIALTSTATPIAIAQVADRAYVASSGLTFTTNATANTSTKIFSINAATTGQNWYSFMIEAWIAQASLANVAFPLTVNGPNSVSLGNGWEWRGWASSQTQGTGISNTSLALLSRDGMRYVAANGTVNAIWSAILTLDTTAGLQVEYRQATAGTITSAANTGPMDQLVQVYGSASYGNYDYRGHMVLKVRKVGYTSPKPDLVATYGNLEDQLYVAGLDPELLYTTTNADPGSIAFDNTAKTAILSASRSILQLYQGAQWWSIQDAQWDADIPVTANTAGSTFTLATGWTLSGLNYITGTQTIAGGTITLAGPATYTPTFSANTAVTAQGEGTYVLNASSTNITFAPTANGVTYVMGDCVFSGTINFHNTHATRAITIEVPSGTSYTTSTAGGTVTVTAPQVYQSVTLTGFTTGSLIQIYDTDYSFVVSGVSVHPAAGDTYTQNGVTYTIISSSGTSLHAYGLTISEASGTLTRTSGSGDASITFSSVTDAGTALFTGTSSSGDTVISGSTCTWTDSTPAAALRYIRVRIGYVSGATAKAFTEAMIGTCAVSGSGKDVSYLVTQGADTSYNTNAINGPSIYAASGITFTDAATDIVNCNIPGGAVTWPTLYACFVHWVSNTTTGIADDITYMDAPDTANYICTRMKLKDTSGSGLSVTGGWGRDAVTGLSITLWDSSGGAIGFSADHAVPYSAGSGLTAGQAAEVTTAATAAAAASTQSTLARKYLSNKRWVNTANGVETVYDDDGSTLQTRPVYDDNGVTPYDGTNPPHRVDKYT